MSLLSRRRAEPDTPARNEIFYWNPAQPRFPGRVGRRLPFTVRPNNFGDLLGPLVVGAMAERAGRDALRPLGQWQLLSIGSVMHFARDGAVVWGSGVNGKMNESLMTFEDLDVRAVRGPRTAERLMSRGIAVPEVFGDPGLLVSRLFPDVQITTEQTRLHRTVVVPNLRDQPQRMRLGEGDLQLDPRRPLIDVLKALANSRLVVGSSLHALIVAESFGVPARMIAPQHESTFKYADYYEGTGRSTFRTASSVEEAVELGGEPLPVWDAQPLIDAFPAELWDVTSDWSN